MTVQPELRTAPSDVAEEPYAPRRVAWRMAAIFCLAGFISYVHRLILSVLVDPIRHDLAISDSQLSLLQGAAFAVIYVFAGLAFGRMADVLQRRRVLIAGTTVWCLGTLACGAAPSYALLFAGRVLVGVGESALTPAAVSMIADTFPPHRRGTAIGIFLMGTVLGGPAAITIGGVLLQLAQNGAFRSLPLIGAFAPWRLVLVVVGISGLLVPLLVLTLREPRRRGGLATASLATGLQRMLLQRGVLIPLYLAMGLLSIGDYGLWSWVPALLSRRFAWTPAEIGICFGIVTAVAGVTGSIAGGTISDWADRRRGVPGRLTASLAAAAAAILSAAAIAIPAASMVVLGLGLWTFLSAVSAIGGIAAVQEVVPAENRGTGMSLVAFCNTLLGLGFGPTLVAVTTERVYGQPTSVGFAVATVVVPAAVIASILFARARRAARQAAAV